LRNKKIFISIFTLCILLLFGFMRWDHLESESSGDFKYKYDRWTGQKWVEFYPPLASSPNSMEFPLIYIDEILPNDINNYLAKQALSGELVNKWIERTQFTDGYSGLLLLNIIVTVYSCLKIWMKKRNTR